MRVCSSSLRQAEVASLLLSYVTISYSSQVSFPPASGPSKSDLEFEDIVYSPAPKELKEGEVYIVERFDEGRAWTVPLFFRKHLTAQYNRVSQFMQSDTKTILNVTGAPGCGKTCFFILLAKQMILLKKRVLFIQAREATACMVSILDMHGWKKVTQKLTLTDVPGVVKRVLADAVEGGFDFCILDGIRSSVNLFKVLISEINVSDKIKKQMFVTSFEFTFKAGELQPGMDGSSTDLCFNSWGLEEYTVALESPLLQDKLTRKRLLADYEVLCLPPQDSYITNAEGTPDDQSVTDADATEAESFDETAEDRIIMDAMTMKFFFAGGSARFMFAVDIESLQDYLAKECDRVTDWLAFAKGQVAARSTNAINSLMQKFSSTKVGESDKCVAVSKYVMFRAYEGCRDELTKAVSAAADATNNPALLGWAFELSQLDLIHAAYKSQHTTNGVKQSVGNDCFRMSPLYEAHFDGQFIKEQAVQNGTVIWCTKWNQGCFDVAYYSDNTLITIQFTISQTHSLKLQYLKILRDALNTVKAKVTTVVHVAVVKTDVEQFKFDYPQGSGKPTRNSAPAFSVGLARVAELELVDQAKDIAPPKWYDQQMFAAGESEPYSNKRRRT